jgi:hypothetical protein
MRNKPNEGIFIIDGVPFEHEDVSEIDKKHPCELVSPLYEEVGIRATNPKTLKNAVEAVIQAVKKDSGSPERPSSIALRVAAQRSGIKARLCVVFKS